MKFVAGLLGGVLLGVFGTPLVAVPVYIVAPEHVRAGAGTFLVLWIAGMVVALSSRSAARAWRHLLLLTAVLCFVWPLAGFIVTGSWLDDVPDAAGFRESAKAALSGTLITGVLGFAGTTAGVVFLLIGLLVGRDRPSDVPAETKGGQPGSVEL